MYQLTKELNIRKHRQRAETLRRKSRNRIRSLAQTIPSTSSSFPLFHYSCKVSDVNNISVFLSPRISAIHPRNIPHQLKRNWQTAVMLLALLPMLPVSKSTIQHFRYDQLSHVSGALLSSPWCKQTESNRKHCSNNFSQNIAQSPLFLLNILKPSGNKTPSINCINRKFLLNHIV